MLVMPIWIPVLTCCTLSDVEDMIDDGLTLTIKWQNTSRSLVPVGGGDGAMDLDMGVLVGLDVGHAMMQGISSPNRAAMKNECSMKAERTVSNRAV